MTEDNLSRNECTELEQIMNLKYASSLKGRLFSIETTIEANQAEVQVILKSLDETFYYPVQGRCLSPHNQLDHKEASKEAALVILDYIDYYFEEYFKEEENIFLPIDWTEYSFEGMSFQLKGQVKNLKAEKGADAILANSGENPANIPHSLS